MTSCHRSTCTSMHVVIVAIAKILNAEMDNFGCKLIIHGLIELPSIRSLLKRYRLSTKIGSKNAENKEDLITRLTKMNVNHAPPSPDNMAIISPSSSPDASARASPATAAKMSTSNGSK